MKKILLLIILAVSQLANAKPRIINIDEELMFSNSIEHCKIVSFSDSTINYELSYNKIDGNSKTSNSILLRTAKLKGFNRNIIGFEASGSLPKLGQICYIVIDTLGFVSLFGIENEGFIIFWSPIYTGSECLIRHSKLFICDDKVFEIDNYPNFSSCWSNVKISITDFFPNIFA